ncbi:hypothetical protein O181_040602 [Austropuccinia psidii MF-1]|uniref:Reverse transcriptase Ty1/copia-type domain-containing protein n=1 Tax=Austropuccinia psidii MF-1 TaxID=1389203 RepID=A0A9Q3DF49_9BASI|nr:hypothetical protein [Austropuccinia psidii MF-1]
MGEGEVALSQTRLTSDIINAYPRKIVRHDSPLPPISMGSPFEREAVVDATPFRSVIGSLAYLVRGTRLDLVFAVNYLARHLMAPTATHWTILDHLVGYLLKTRGHGITLRPGNCSLNLWSDAGWGMRWNDPSQVSYSSWHLVQAVNQLTQPAQDFKKTIFCDNQVAVQVSINNLSCKRMQYLERAFFFVNNVIRKHGVVVKWVTTQEMWADALTKRLSGKSLTQALRFLNVTGNR